LEIQELPNFIHYLGGNPAMQEIWEEAKKRLDHNETLTPVQEVVLREWIHLASARRNVLEIQDYQKTLSPQEFQELNALRMEIESVKEKMGGADL
jgi:hypothetical protein